MKFQLFLGGSFIYISYFVLVNNRIPDAIYFQPLLTNNSKYIVSSVCLLFGLYCLRVAYNLYIKGSQKKLPEHSKCPKCEQTYTYIELKNGICPKCDIKTIDISKYYDNER